jgi:hypothetical protein
VFQNLPEYSKRLATIEGETNAYTKNVEKYLLERNCLSGDVVRRNSGEWCAGGLACTFQGNARKDGNAS